MDTPTSPTPGEYQRFTELVKDIRVAMLTTFTASGELHTRPMYTQSLKDAAPRELWFLTDLDSAKAEELRAHPRAHVSYADAGTNKYVVAVGRADVVRDPERVRKVWSIHAKAWFPNGPDDPNIGLLRVKVERGEYWDGPSKVAYAFGLLKALATGEQPIGGDHHTVSVTAGDMAIAQQG